MGSARRGGVKGSNRRFVSRSAPQSENNFGRASMKECLTPFSPWCFYPLDSQTSVSHRDMYDLLQSKGKLSRENEVPCSD